MKIPRIIISALKGGGGKTLLSLGIITALRLKKFHIAPFKKGPDYIDAMWLSLAAKAKVYNLDPYFLNDAKLKALFQESAILKDIAVIEGNRGLYDGKDIAGSCSTAALAKTLDCPVILSVDCTKVTRTTAAMLVGMLNFDSAVKIAGVVLNNVSSQRHESLTRQCIEHYTDLKVFGAISRLQENPLPERHMGLVAFNSQNTAEIENILAKLADIMENSLDLHSIIALMQKNSQWTNAGEFWVDENSQNSECSNEITENNTSLNSNDLRQVKIHFKKPVIAYVRDAALWFYYNENLEALSRAGAELVELSILSPKKWPNIQGLYLGGGYPEEFAEKLSASPHLEKIQELSLANIPIYAECGGFMLLANALVRNNVEYTMAKIFPCKTYFNKKPQGLGYVDAEVVSENIFHPLHTIFRGHEFHYSHCIFDPDAKINTIFNLKNGVGMGNGKDGLLIRNTFASYTHLYAPAIPSWAKCFVYACQTITK